MHQVVKGSPLLAEEVYVTHSLSLELLQSEIEEASSLDSPSHTTTSLFLLAPTTSCVVLRLWEACLCSCCCCFKMLPGCWRSRLPNQKGSQLGALCGITQPIAMCRGLQMLTHGIWVVIHPHTTFAKYFHDELSKKKDRKILTTMAHIPAF